MAAPDAPRLTIILQLEERPRVVEDALTESESRRLEDWVKSQPELLKLVRYALHLQTRRAA